ncbi:MAG: SUMF1/EgtB/PvdO family nonheme iron enzyme [Candidatus Lernaella stagnicola]|nr:SUMF1/EgtB/PvdO family nonheme iron enzyme [Candidatus Lernaella stagnicola]
MTRTAIRAVILFFVITLTLGAMGAGVFFAWGWPERGAPVPPTMTLIPAGMFISGCDHEKDPQCTADDPPLTTGYLPAFFLDRVEVTVADFARCVAAGECEPPPDGQGCNYGISGRENHPVNCVNQLQGREYCAFVGKRLPTATLWEKAARGVDGRIYPWGNEFNPRFGNFGDEGRADGFTHTAPVGSFPEGRGSYGNLDLAGNVAEWTTTRRTTYYDPARPAVTGPQYKGISVVLKGGSFMVERPALLRMVGSPKSRPVRFTTVLGFRCFQATWR